MVFPQASVYKIKSNYTDSYFTERKSRRKPKQMFFETNQTIFTEAVYLKTWGLQDTQDDKDTYIQPGKDHYFMNNSSLLGT